MSSTPQWLCAFVALSLAHLTSSQPPESPPPGPDQVCLMVPPDVEQCYASFQDRPISDRAAQVNCLQKLLWNYSPNITLTAAETDYFKELVQDMRSRTRAGPMAPTSPSGFRIRREYGTLSLIERSRFHDALNALYRNGTIRAFARLHAQASFSHHQGASFLPWHRVFLVMFEEALRRVDRTVALPYWDSTINNDVDNPVNSVLFGHDYFGNGVGSVTSGPFAGWVTDQGDLERYYGRASRLFSKAQIRNVLSQCRMQDISKPTASRLHDFERYHGGPHVWVGGDMSSPVTAGYDPIFYMHHAFVDYVWELFRRRQERDCQVDPSRDYPDVLAGSTHHPDHPMTGLDGYINRDGIGNVWTTGWYRYHSTPACPDCCQGQCGTPETLYCDTRKRSCVRTSRRVTAFGPRESRPSVTREQFYEPAELLALETLPTPRNRGQIFEAPPSDGRTLATAFEDASAAIPARTRNRALGSNAVQPRSPVPVATRTASDLPATRARSRSRFAGFPSRPLSSVGFSRPFRFRTVPRRVK